MVVSSIPGEAPATTARVLRRAADAERATYAAYGELAEVKEAIQASVMWLTVYTPYASGLMLTLARSSMGGGDSQCDWCDCLVPYPTKYYHRHHIILYLIHFVAAKSKRMWLLRPWRA